MQRLGIQQDVSLHQTWLTKIITMGLQYFGHLAQASPREDHHRVVAAALQRPPEWKGHLGCPATSRPGYVLWKTTSCH